MLIGFLKMQNQRYIIKQGEPVSAPMMFWVLIALGACGLVPSILLPQWRQYEKLALARQHEAHLHAQMEAAVGRERQMLQAVHTDPAVVSRIAQRELGFKPATQVEVRVQPLYGATIEDSGAPSLASGITDWEPELPRISDSEPASTPVHPPAFVTSIVSSLPRLNYDAVFCDEQTRMIVIVMSIIIICMALALYGWSRDGEPRDVQP